MLLMPSAVRMKGTNFLGTLWAFDQKFGEKGRRDLLALLGDDLRELLETRSILASAWYPVAYFDQLLTAIVEVGGGEESLLLELAAEAVARDFRTLFRVMRLVISPTLALKQALRVSRRYVDGGEIEIIEVEGHYVHYRFTKYYGYTHFLWVDWIGGIVTVLANFGCEQIDSQVVKGGKNGDDFLELVVRWT